MARLLAVFAAAPVGRAGPSAGASPPMGWSTWNHYHWEISDDIIEASAVALKESGLLELGYNRVNLDGGWWEGANTGIAVRNASGHLQAHPTLFPDMPGLSQRVHHLGFRFGLYANSGPKWCNKDAGGGFGYEKQDVDLFASWGADMFKVDACGLEKGDETANATRALLAKWHEAVLAAASSHGRSPMLMSNCHNGCMSATQKRHGGWEEWCTELSDIWRTSSDVDAAWSKVMNSIDSMKGIQDQAGPHRGWNDPDFLEVGNVDVWTGRGPLSDVEARTHFSLWCVTSAPLIIGCDVRNMSATTLEILSNAEAVAVNQQWAGHAGDFLASSESVEVWGKPQSDGKLALVIFNRGTNSSNASVFDVAPLASKLDLKIAESYSVHDIWTHARANSTSGTMLTVRSLASHDSCFLLLEPETLMAV